MHTYRCIDFVSDDDGGSSRGASALSPIYVFNVNVGNSFESYSSAPKMRTTFRVDAQGRASGNTYVENRSYGESTSGG